MITKTAANFFSQLGEHLRTRLNEHKRVLNLYPGTKADSLIFAINPLDPRGQRYANFYAKNLNKKNIAPSPFINSLGEGLVRAVN